MQPVDFRNTPWSASIIPPSQINLFFNAMENRAMQLNKIKDSLSPSTLPNPTANTGSQEDLPSVKLSAARMPVAVQPISTERQAKENSSGVAKEPSATVVPLSPECSAQKSEGTKIPQIAWEKLEKNRRAGFLIPTSQVTVGLQLEEKRYQTTDPEILEDADRNATSKRLDANGSLPNWTECLGVVELGVRPKLGLTLPGVPGAKIGFATDGLVQYRSLKPYPAPKSGELSQSSPEVSLPTTVESALKLPRGSEVEVRGRGTVKGSLGAFGGPSAGLTDVVSAGASASVGVARKYSGELSLRVKKLEGRCVRVDIADIDEASTNIGAQVKAGLSMDAATSRLGEGLLITAVRNGATKDLEKIVKVVKNANLAAKLSYESGTQDRDIYAIVLDLGNPKARSIYGELWGLDTTKAEELASQQGTGVFVAKATDTQETETFDANVSFLGEKLVLYKALEQVRTGNFQGADGKKLVYYDASYDQTFSNVITGSSDIKWQAVSLDGTEPGSASKPYFRMKFSANDKVTEQHEVDSVFRFAKSLKLDTSCGDSKLNEGSLLGRLWRTGDDTKIDIDIYFTPAGIEKIDKASKATTVVAALRALQVLEPQCAGLPFGDAKIGSYASRTVAQYVRKKSENSIWSFWPFNSTSKIAQEYLSKTGRDIEVDASAFTRAMALGSHIDGLDARRGSRKLTEFFAALGEQRGFNYQLAISTLANLAGENDTLIHQFEVKGQEVSFKAKDEGALEEVTPQRMMRTVRSNAA